MSEPRRFCSQSILKNALAPLSRKAKIELAGNGVCVATLGAWILYVLSHVRRKPADNIARLPPPATDAEGDTQPSQVEEVQPALVVGNSEASGSEVVELSPDGEIGLGDLESDFMD